MRCAQLACGRCRAHCGPRETDPSDRDAVVSPTLIVEVLSPSTEEYDRGDKLEHYQQIPALRQYVLVAHDARHVQVWTRGAGGEWTRRDAGDGDQVELASIGAVLDVRGLYAAAEPVA